MVAKEATIIYCRGSWDNGHSGAIVLGVVLKCGMATAQEKR